MDKELIEKYKRELMEMYRSSPAAKYAAAPQNNISEIQSEETGRTNITEEPNRADFTEEPERIDMPPIRGAFPPDDGTGDQQGVYEEGNPSLGEDASDPKGRLVTMVTAVANIYPIEGATVTVFTGPYENMTALDSDITDASGKTKVFELSAPPRSLSMDATPTESPFTLYNLMVEADGYTTNVHLNIPIFRGVTSLQRSNLLPLSASAGNKGPIIYDESTGFGL